MWSKMPTVIWQKLKDAETDSYGMKQHRENVKLLYAKFTLWIAIMRNND